MPDPLPESEEALRAKIRDLEREAVANREAIAALKKRLDDMDSIVLDDDEEEAELEPWA